jgi:hypothetical protein
MPILQIAFQWKRVNPGSEGFFLRLAAIFPVKFGTSPEFLVFSPRTGKGYQWPDGKIKTIISFLVGCFHVNQPFLWGVWSKKG